MRYEQKDPGRERVVAEKFPVFGREFTMRPRSRGAVGAYFPSPSERNGLSRDFLKTVLSSERGMGIVPRMQVFFYSNLDESGLIRKYKFDHGRIE
jgi:hypothetical protein